MENWQIKMVPADIQCFIIHIEARRGEIHAEWLYSFTPYLVFFIPVNEKDVYCIWQQKKPARH